MYGYLQLQWTNASTKPGICHNKLLICSNLETIHTRFSVLAQPLIKGYFIMFYYLTSWVCLLLWFPLNVSWEREADCVPWGSDISMSSVKANSRSSFLKDSSSRFSEKGLLWWWFWSISLGLEDWLGCSWIVDMLLDRSWKILMLIYKNRVHFMKSRRKFFFKLRNRN